MRYAHDSATGHLPGGRGRSDLKARWAAHPGSTQWPKHEQIGARSGRSGAAGSAVSRGAKRSAAGIARRAFPWRQAPARSAAGAKAWGI